MVPIRRASLGDLRSFEMERHAVGRWGRVFRWACHVDNLVDAAVSASKVPNTVGKAYNITDDETVSWKRL